MTTTTRIPRFATLGLASTIAVSLLAGCGGGNADNEPSRTVPASAGESPAAFINYLRNLPSNDTDEPVSLDGFTAPIDDTSDSTPLT